MQESFPYWVPDVELVFILARPGFAFPTETPAGTGRRMTPFFELFARPPVTQLLRHLCVTLDCVLGGLGLSDWRRSDFSSVEIGIYKKGGATLLGVPEILATKPRAEVAHFAR